MRNYRKFFVLGIALMVFAVLTGPVLAEEAVLKININTADAQTLTQLNRIGPTLAARIVEYREKNGPFKTPEEIMKVKGIGEKTFELIKDHIVVK